MSVKLPEPSAGECFHCLQPLPADGGYQVTLQHRDYPVCCYGCQAVAQTIAEQGLLHFYQFRDRSNPLNVPLVPEQLQRFEAYDDERLQQQFTRDSSAPGGRETSLSVEGMTCSACAWLIEKHLAPLAGIDKVMVNASSERVTVSWQPEQTKLSTILQHIAELGYRALPFQSASQEQDFKKRRRYFVTRLGVAGLATMQVMMIAVGLYFGMVSDLDDALRQFLWWISLLFATPVLLYSAQPFYLSALRSIQAQRPNMDVPVSLALLSTYLASAYATIINEGEVYFESVCMFTFFLLLGRYLELLARQRAISAAANLIKLLPAVAQRKNPSNQLENVAVADLRANDIVVVAAGSTIPADGKLLHQAAYVNEALMTGESHAVLKQPGEMVLAGSVNQQQIMQLQVTATHQDTVLASIVALQDIALSRKPKWVENAERLAQSFVKQVLIMALVTFLVWTWIEPSEAFWVTIAVLVATCPCALALAAPTAVTGAIHKLNKQGVIVRNADVLTTMASIKTIFVDKTGTLTNGQFELLNHYQHQHSISLDTLLALIQALERYSEHPLAQPLKQLTSTQVDIDNVHVVAGCGVSGHWQQQQLRLGSLAWVREWHPNFKPHGASATIFLVSETEVLLELQVGDQLRHGVAEAISTLQSYAIEIVMLTGDRAELAAPIAEQLGIKQVHAQCLPADKLAHLAERQQQHPVMMIGDGINDGPVLAQADISVSFAQASDLARSAADAVLLRNQFSALIPFYQTALRSQRIMRQNVRWALVYNIAILPVAMLGLITPYIAALGMSASSLLVLLNSLRLYR